MHLEKSVHHFGKRHYRYDDAASEISVLLDSFVDALYVLCSPIVYINLVEKRMRLSLSFIIASISSTPESQYITKLLVLYLKQGQLQ